MNGFHKLKVVNVNTLPGESPVLLIMYQITLRGSAFGFIPWLGFLPADRLICISIYFSLFLLKFKT